MTRFRFKRNPPNTWTDERIASEIMFIAADLGRMPTTPELAKLGRNDLSCAISHSIGFSRWAKRLGLPLAGTETHRGHAIEAHAKRVLESAGYRVERCATLAPFDLMVNGAVRVDVKSARHTEYRSPRGALCAGHVFHLAKAQPTCDLYMLVGVSSENDPLWIYYVPAASARVQTITITPRGKYTQFKNAIGELSRLVDAARKEAA